MLGRDKVVVHLLGQLFPPAAASLKFARKANLRRSAVHLGLACQFTLYLLGQHARLQAQPLDDQGHYAVRLAQQRQQQVLALDLSVAIFTGQALRLDQSFLCFFCIPL